MNRRDVVGSMSSGGHCGIGPEASETMYLLMWYQQMNGDMQSEPTFVTWLWLCQGGGRWWGMSIRKLHREKRPVSEYVQIKRTDPTYLNGHTYPSAAEVGDLNPVAPYALRARYVDELE